MERRDIPLSRIVQNENSRSIYRNEELQELMASMAQDGILHPIGVAKSGDQYEVLFGNRRFMAAKKLGWHDIPCTVLGVSSSVDKDILNLAENIKRTNITAYDEGRIYHELVKKGLSYQEICAKLGIKVERIRNCFEIFNEIPKEFRNKIVPTLHATAHKGKITARVAGQLLNISKDASLRQDQATELFRSSISEGLTMSQTKALATMIGQGTSAQKAMKNITKVDHITVSFVVKRSVKNEVQKKYGKSYNKVVVSYLQKNTELGVHKNDEAAALASGQVVRPVTKVIRRGGAVLGKSAN